MCKGVLWRKPDKKRKIGILGIDKRIILNCLINWHLVSLHSAAIFVKHLRILHSIRHYRKKQTRISSVWARGIISIVVRRCGRVNFFNNEL